MSILNIGLYVISSSIACVVKWYFSGSVLLGFIELSSTSFIPIRQTSWKRDIKEEVSIDSDADTEKLVQSTGSEYSLSGDGSQSDEDDFEDESEKTNEKKAEDKDASQPDNVSFEVDPEDLLFANLQ